MPSDRLTAAVPVCIFAKPPRAGLVKTRLASVVGEETAAALAKAFLGDTWDRVSGLGWVRPILATTDVAWGRASGLEAREVWLQGDGDLGARLERVLARALESGAGALALGADSPGLPVRALEQARAVVAGGVAAVGPTDDGGYYLLGLPRCPPGLLADLPWSAPDTRERTIDRLRGSGIRVELLEPWFDIDRPADLVRMRQMLASGHVDAPRTAAVLASFPVQQ